MKHLIIAIAALASLTASAQTGVDAMAKQRARDAANQNNNRSMEPPGATPAAPAARPAPAAPTITATPLNASQQAFARFQSQLFLVNSNSTPDVKQTLAKDLTNVAQGAKKPSPATLSKLSDHLTTALGEAKLTTQKKTRLAQDVGVLVNSANTPAAQKTAMIKDVESILQSGGSSSENAAAVAADLQTVTEEVMPPAK
jgi:alanyl-tRNA synthetase